MKVFNIFGSWVLLTLLLACTELTIPGNVSAEPDAIIYENSILHDDDENKLSFPSFVMLDQKRDEIYVVDSRSRIMIYTADLFPLYIMDDEYGIESPRGLALDDAGNLYVAQSASKSEPRHRISVYRPCLRKDRDIFIENVQEVNSFIPHRLAIDRDGNIFVASSHYPGVFVLNNNGAVIDILAPEDTKGRKVTLTNVTIDEAGHIYLVSEDAGRIYIYDNNRKIIASFGEKGGSTGKLSRPRSVAIDSFNGNMYVVDYMRHAVTIYSSSGSYIHEFGGLGWGAGWFQYPGDIAVDKNGRLFVADLFNHRVQIFKTR